MNELDEKQVDKDKLAKDLIPDDLLLKIVEVSINYHGFIDGLYESIGFLVVGRLFGWRVVRLAASRRQWERATALFGDLKELMPERGELSRKSVGLNIIDKIGGYWAFINGNASREKLSRLDRQTLTK